MSMFRLLPTISSCYQGGRGGLRLGPRLINDLHVTRGVRVGGTQMRVRLIEIRVGNVLGLRFGVGLGLGLGLGLG